MATCEVFFFPPPRGRGVKRVGKLQEEVLVWVVGECVSGGIRSVGDLRGVEGGGVNLYSA